jgi:hypothetical protein
VLQSLRLEIIENAADITMGTGSSKGRDALQEAFWSWQEPPWKIPDHIESEWLSPFWGRKPTNLGMLKCKNEATMLLKIKENAWVRFPKRTHFSRPTNPIGGG